MSSTSILVIFVILVIYMFYGHGNSIKKVSHRQSYAKPTHRHGPGCRHANPHRDHSDPHDHLANDERQHQVLGLNELEQDPQTRGFVPYANQPDHVGNMWKTDRSQSGASECGCTSECPHNTKKYNSYESDIYTPLRERAINQNIADVSNMHIISRFGCVSS